MLRRLSLLAVALLLPAATALAEGGHGAEPDPGSTIGWQQLHWTAFWGSVFNFALLVWLIWYFGRKPVRAFLETRRAEVQAAIEEATRLKQAAEAKRAEYQQRLDKLESELEQIRADMVRAGEAERDRIVAEAEQKAARARKETAFVIEQQAKQMRADLSREAVESAVATAERLLNDKATASDHERLAKHYLDRVAEVGGQGAGSQA
ncbi:MAG: ATP synthase F0 subunit B [Myxococcales bacterium]|nr:ATP synthase F0 subunit B [Myxococcales bacterium]